jgi:hypothetical protein
MLVKIGIFRGKSFKKSFSQEIPRKIPRKITFRGKKYEKSAPWSLWYGDGSSHHEPYVILAWVTHRRTVKIAFITLAPSTVNFEIETCLLCMYVCMYVCSIISVCRISPCSTTSNGRYVILSKSEMSNDKMSIFKLYVDVKMQTSQIFLPKLTKPRLVTTWLTPNNCGGHLTPVE